MSTSPIARKAPGPAMPTNRAGVTQHSGASADSRASVGEKGRARTAGAAVRHQPESGRGAHICESLVSTGAASCTGANITSPLHGENIQLVGTGGCQNTTLPSGCSPWKTRDMSNRRLLVLRMSGFLVQHQHGLAGFGFRVGIGGGAVRQLGPDARPVVGAEISAGDGAGCGLLNRGAVFEGNRPATTDKLVDHGGRDTEDARHLRLGANNVAGDLDGAFGCVHASNVAPLH